MMEGIMIGVTGILAFDRAIDGRLGFALTYGAMCAVAVAMAFAPRL